MATATLPRINPAYDSAQNNMALSGAPVVSDEDIQKQQQPEKKEKKDKDKKDKKKDKKKKKDNKKKDKKKDNKKDNKKEDTVEKPIRQAVGVIVIDAATQKVLLLSSRKREGAYVLPRGDCNANPDEHPEKAALRILQETAGASATFLTNRVGSYAEANKKGKVVAHHWMYEVHSPVFQNTWPESERQRVWVTYNEALAATKNKRMSHLALQKCSLAKTIV